MSAKSAAAYHPGTGPLPSLAGIEARVGAATEGPWQVVPPSHYASTFVEMPSTDRVVMSIHTRNEDNDLTLIAAAPTDLAALTAAVRAVLDAIERHNIEGSVFEHHITDALAAHLDLS